MQSGPANISSFAEVTNESQDSIIKNDEIGKAINGSIEIMPKKGKTAVSSTRKG